MSETTEMAKAALKQGCAIDGVHVRALLQEIATRDYGGTRPMARAWNVSAPYLSDVLRGRRDAGPKLLQRLGVAKRVTVTYRRAEGAGAGA